MAAGEDLRSVARVGAEAENNPGRKPEGGPGARLTLALLSHAES